MRNAIGIDIGGTNFRIGRVYEDGTVACAEKKSSRVLCSGGSAVELLIGEVERFMQANPAEDTCALGIGFPAPVSSDGKTVFACPNLKNPDGEFGHAVEPMSDYFHMPVYIAKDTDMLLQAEITERRLGNDEIVTAFYFGTGVGNSVYYRGAILTGAHGSGCDTGHIPVYRGTRECGCGQMGCIECYASGTALKALWEERFLGCVNCILRNGQTKNHPDVE